VKGATNGPKNKQWWFQYGYCTLENINNKKEPMFNRRTRASTRLTLWSWWPCVNLATTYAQYYERLMPNEPLRSTSTGVTGNSRSRARRISQAKFGLKLNRHRENTSVPPINVICSMPNVQYLFLALKLGKSSVNREVTVDTEAACSCPASLASMHRLSTCQAQSDRHEMRLLIFRLF
jgi:hypothetical protein